MFIFNQEEHANQNMHFRMHESSLHYYDTEDEDFVFVNKFIDNKESYRKWQIKFSEQARELYASLGYPPVKY